MKNNYTSSKNYKTGFVVLLLLFFGLFANKTAAQVAVDNHDTFIWKGTVSSAWDNTANWTILRGVKIPGINTYPGELTVTDVVFINKRDTPFPAILDGVFDIARLNVQNAFGGEEGATFTINPGANLFVGNYTLLDTNVPARPVTQSNNVLLNGGNIINNGTLTIIGLGVGFTNFPSIGINCGNPIVLPTVPREYGYSGSGTLSISLPNALFVGAAAIAVTGSSAAPSPAVFPIPVTNNANAKYRIILNNPEITLNQVQLTVLAVGQQFPTVTAIRAAGGSNANKLIIGGTGFTYGTVGTPVIGGLLSVAGGSSVTVEAGTTLTLNSASTNRNNAMSGFIASNFPANFTNKGTINIQGASERSGMLFSTGAAAVSATNPGGVTPVLNISNEGTLNVNLNAGAGHSTFTIGNGGGIAAGAGVAVNLSNSGTMTLKNTAATAGTGFPIFTVTAGEAANLFITNSGTMNLEGSTYAYGLKTTLNNTGVLNSNNELRSFREVNNNVGGSINFVRTPATSTTRLVNFTILTETNQTGGVGSIYRDSNNNDYGIVAQKFGTGFSVLANVLSSVTVPPTGILTRITGTGAVTIDYTAVGISPLNNAATGNVNNSGTINTGTASNLNILSLLSTTATSVLSPGGDSGKGILTVPDFPTAAAENLALQGTLKLQASGNATAGVDYDTVQITGSLDVININGATLDVTGLYTPAVLTTIDIITTYIDSSVPLTDLTNKSGAVTGNFASVVGLPAKWTVVKTPGLGNKVQLVYDPNLGTDKFAQAQFSYYPNPTRNELNITAAATISKVELFTILGQRVQSEIVNNTQKQLNISNLQNGMYLMEVTIDNAKESFKIIKK